MTVHESFLLLLCHFQRILVIYFVDYPSVWVYLMFPPVRSETSDKDITEVVVGPSQCIRAGVHHVDMSEM